MNNLTNTNGINSQPGAGVVNTKEEIILDPVQQKEETKKLRLEIGTKTLQIKKKLQQLYDIEPTKETYDNIINIDSLTI